MDVKAIPALIVGVMVAVVMVGAVLPVFADTTQAYDTFTNEGMWRMAPNTNGDVYTYDNTDKTWSLNGTVVNDSGVANVSVILLDDLTIRSNGWVRGAQITGNSVTTVVTNANDQTVITGNGLSGNGTYTIQGYGVNPNGDYLMTSYDKPAYMNGDSSIYATGVTAIGATFDAIFHITGNIDDGVSIVASKVRNVAYTISDESIDDVVIHYTPVNGYNDLYILSGITFNYSCTATPTGDGDPVTITKQAVSYSSYVVPYEITAERSVHTEGPLTVLINVLPLMAVAGLLLSGVAWFVWKKG